MYAPRLETISDNQRKCPHCGKAGGLTYQKSEKEQVISGLHFSAKPAHWHCCTCGCNTPLEATK